MDYPGVIGPEMTARWFTERAWELGLKFLEPEPQQIYSISDTPRYPGAPGSPRFVGAEDAPLLADWLVAFYREAVPSDPLPPREELERGAGEVRFLFWIENGQPMSMAGIVRRLNRSSAITGVYTPPEHRGRGYAGSVTAANGRAHLRRGAQDRLSLCGPEKPGLEPLLYESRFHSGLRIAAFPQTTRMTKPS